MCKVSISGLPSLIRVEVDIERFPQVNCSAFLSDVVDTEGQFESATALFDRVSFSAFGCGEEATSGAELARALDVLFGTGTVRASADDDSSI